MPYYGFQALLEYYHKINNDNIQNDNIINNKSNKDNIKNQSNKENKNEKDLKKKVEFDYEFEQGSRNHAGNK